MSMNLGGLSHLNLRSHTAPGQADYREDRAREMRDLQAQVEQLTLVCMAMWSLVREETNLTEDDLIKRVRDLDLFDGVPDGRVTPQIAKCSGCNRVMSPRHKKCIYCGKDRLILSAFDAL